MRSKWDAFWNKSTVFIMVGIWMLFITTYNLVLFFAEHGLFSLIGAVLGIIVLAYMWLQLDAKEKPYKRYYG